MKDREIISAQHAAQLLAPHLLGRARRGYEFPASTNRPYEGVSYYVGYAGGGIWYRRRVSNLW